MAGGRRRTAATWWRGAVHVPSSAPRARRRALVDRNQGQDRTGDRTHASASDDVTMHVRAARAAQPSPGSALVDRGPGRTRPRD